MKRWHVRTTYSAYSTLVKIYKLVSGFDLLCVGRWLPRRAILSGTGTVTYACTSVVLLGIISPCDGYLLLVYLKATSVHLSSCHITCDCLPGAMDVCSLFISTPLACICHPARQLVTRPLQCSNEGKWNKDFFVHFNSTKVSRLLRKHIPGTPPDSAALTDPKPTDPGGSLTDGRRKSFRAASGDHDYDKCILCQEHFSEALYTVATFECGARFYHMAHALQLQPLLTILTSAEQGKKGVEHDMKYHKSCFTSITTSVADIAGTRLASACSRRH